MTGRRAVSRILLACLLASSVSACAGSSVNRKKEAEARVQMGVTYLEQRNLPMAMRELTRADELDPGNPEVEMMLGLTYQARGDLAKAEEYLRRALDRKPDYGDAHNNLGIILAKQKRLDEAAREFEAAAGNVLYTTPEWAYYNLGEVERMRKEPARAEEAYRRSLRANERYAPSYIGLASLLGEKGKWDEAAAVLARCVQLLPEFAPGWMELGRIHVRLKRPAEAENDFNKVLAVSSDPELRKQAAGYLAILRGEKR
ncbi:MAG: Tetratricopeptide 1 repeat-containing protein [Deltaproteobacteria bacterium]|nr:Tetratricopeptide 1 repeat-containing protein [Deltaproteobacteria bacterium]